MNLLRDSHAYAAVLKLVFLVAVAVAVAFASRGADAGTEAGSEQRAVAGGLAARYELTRWTRGNRAIAGWLEVGAGWQRAPAHVPESRGDAMVGIMYELRTGRLGTIVGRRMLVAQSPQDRRRLYAIGTSQRGIRLDTGVVATLGIRWRR